jgi:hypothetical protein
LRPRDVASRALDRRQGAAAMAAGAWRRFMGTLGGRFVEAFFELRVVERSLALAVGSDVVMPELVTHNTARYGLIGFTFSLVSWLFSGAVLVVSAAILGALLDRIST